MEGDDFVDEGAAFEERGPLAIGDPAETEMRVGALDEADGGQGVNDVAEGAGFDDEGGFEVPQIDRMIRLDGHLPSERRSASSGGKPAARIFF